MSEYVIFVHNLHLWITFQGSVHNQSHYHGKHVSSWHTFPPNMSLIGWNYDLLEPFYHCSPCLIDDYSILYLHFSCLLPPSGVYFDKSLNRGSLFYSIEFANLFANCIVILLF